MSRSGKRLHHEAAGGIASSSPSSSSRTSAIRTGVRDTPVVSTACSSGDALARAASPRQDQVAQRQLRAHGLRYGPIGFALGHRFYSAACTLRRRFPVATMRSISAPRPHRAGIDVEVVEDAVGVFVHRALLRFEDDLVLAENAG
mgnify:CR=1 FL=1